MSVAQLETEFFPARANLRLLVSLRTFAIIIQVTAIVAAANAFDVPLPLGPMLGAIALLTVANGLTWIRLRQPRSTSQAEIFGQLLIDAAILAVLPCASSAIDPFSNCYLLLAMFAASALPERHARAPVAVCTLCYAAFQLFYVPPVEAATVVRGIDLPAHWAIYMPLAPLIAWIAGRLNQVREEHSHIVQREPEKGARDHHVLGLAALAAGATHEMNTPLSTMSVVVGDLRRSRTPPADWEKSVDMLWCQIQICRQSLAEMVNTAHAVIDRFGGAIEILERDGGGTCVQVTLPVFRMNETEGDPDHVGAGTPTAVAR